MDDPIAYFITWTTYGSWLPGDARGWVKRGAGLQAADSQREQTARLKMTEDAVVLTPAQRQIVDEVIVQHCQIRRWTPHARNVRTNHVHAVVTAATAPETVREQLKAWGSRRLSEHAELSGHGSDGCRRWWTEKGDIEWIFEEWRLVDVIEYVLHCQ